MPSAVSAVLWPGMCSAWPLALKRPTRGPKTQAPTSAAVPPVMWTTAEPAKSYKPAGRDENQREGLHGYQGLAAG